MNTFLLKMRPFYKLAWVVLFFLLAGITVSQAQTASQTAARSPAVQAMISSELQKRGLTEDEVRAALLQKGIDLDNIPTKDLAQYRSQVTAVLDDLQAKKKAGQSTTQTNSAFTTGSTPTALSQPININVGTLDTTHQAMRSDTSLNQPKITPQEAAADASQRVIEAAAAKEKGAQQIYGHSIFTDHSLDVFRTTDGAQAPDTYVLGQGDEIHITIFGASQTDIQQRIAADGSIQPSGGAKIFLKGLTLGQARQVIRKNLSTSYLFRGDQLAVTIVTARTIMVNVFGEAKIPGGFSLSALNSAFNALSAAGGPTDIGSVRSIQLIRGNIRKNIDLYAFMNDPAIQFKFDLQNNDILFVPVAKKLVAIEGAVKRPMSYEMLPGETLSDLIKYAGGLKENVYLDFVQIQRYIDGEQRLMEWSLKDVRSGRVKVPLLNGDVVRIKTIGKPMDQYVNITGSVYYPGRYDLMSNASLSYLLANAKPSVQAKTDILFIERTRPNETVELLTVPFPNAKTGIPDFTLQEQDSVIVMDQATYCDVAAISVSGQVHSPFKKSIGLNDHLTVKEAIDMAGGLKASVYPVAYVFRRNILDSTEVKYIRVALGQDDKMELQAGDQLNIYDNTTYSNVGELKVFGAVKNPSNYTFDPTMTVRDLLINAGGFTVGAAFNRVEVFRTTLSPTEKVKLDLITLQVDSTYQVVSPQGFKLQPYDKVVVRLTPDFTLGRTVEINGQVNYPGTYVLNSKQTTLKDIIKMAGGLLDDADPYGCRLFRTYKNRGEISITVKRSFWHRGDINNNPIMFEGDVVNINRLENTVTLLENGTRMAQYSINPENNKIRNVVYQGRKSAAWYIQNFAGGFQKEADRNSVTVTFPNNQMQSTRRFLIVFKKYPKVESGSTITMQLKPPKIEPTGDNKFSWDTFWSRTLTAMTSSITMFLLIRQIK